MNPARLDEVLKAFAAFLRARRLVTERELPYMVRHVRSFLVFADRRRDRGFDDVLLAFLDHLRTATYTKERYVRQAGDAVRMYRCQFRHGDERPVQPNPDATGDGPPRPMSIAQVRTAAEQALRVRHYSPRTVRSYLRWIERFHSYRREARGRDSAPPPQKITAGSPRSWASPPSKRLSKDALLLP